MTSPAASACGKKGNLKRRSTSMNSQISKLIAIALILAALGGCRSGQKEAKSSDAKEAVASTQPFQETFDVNKSDLAPRGASKYMILQPGRRHQYAAKNATLAITVLPQTKTIDGVQTAIVEERETKNGQLEEVSRNFFAIDRKTGDLYYFGEEVDIYKDGKITDHEGAWLSGQNGARFGLLVPGQPKVGQRFYAEFAPKVAMDRCEVKDTNATVSTPLLGTFSGCLKIDETTPLEKGVSHKIYAPGIGLIQDDEFILMKIEGGSAAH
jgi:hypothetical protein